MRKRIAVLLTAAVLVLSGCGGKKIEDAKESTVTVNEEGVITQLLAEEFLSESYDLSEMETSVQELITDYNEQNGGERVTMESARLEEGVAYVLLRYASDEDYRGFNRVDFFAGTVSQAVEEGYPFGGDFVDTSGKAADPGKIPADCQDEQVMIIREPMSVLVPGTISYVSGNMELQGTDQARLLADRTAFPEEEQTTTEAYGYVIYHP